MQDERQEGRVIKAYNSFFYVAVNGELIACKLRGKFKKTRKSSAVGVSTAVLSAMLASFLHRYIHLYQEL